MLKWKIIIAFLYILYKDIRAEMLFIYLFLNSETFCNEHISLYQAGSSGFFLASTTGLRMKETVFWKSEENRFRSKYFITYRIEQ